MVVPVAVGSNPTTHPKLNQQVSEMLRSLAISNSNS